MLMAVTGDREPMTSRLGQLDAVSDDGVEVSSREVFADLLDDFSGKLRSAAVKRDERANRDVVSGLPGNHVERLE